MAYTITQVLNPMLENWTPAFVAEIKAQLTDEQRRALELELDANAKPSSNVGEKRLKTFGFKKVEDWWVALDSAKHDFKKLLAEKYKIHKMDDLGFERLSRSNDAVPENMKLSVLAVEEELPHGTVRILTAEEIAAANA